MNRSDVAVAVTVLYFKSLQGYGHGGAINVLVRDQCFSVLQTMDFFNSNVWYLSSLSSHGKRKKLIGKSNFISGDIKLKKKIF